jgi:hypothetical protein
MTKTQKIFMEMLEQNQDLFNKFDQLTPKANRSEFNEIGEKVLDVVKKYEGILCNNTESSKLGKFAPGLAAKFWELIRVRFPEIDEVGMLD